MAEAIRISERAVAAYQKLADADPDTHVPGLGAALTNRALRVAQTGRVDEAIAISERAVELYAGLIEVHPDADMADVLGRSMSNHAMFLAATERSAEAQLFAENAVSIFETLVIPLHSDEYTPALMTSLCVYGDVLLKNGHIADSVHACLSAMQVSSRLPDHLSENARRGAIDTLRNAYNINAGQTEEKFREITGGRFPDQLK